MFVDYNIFSYVLPTLEHVEAYAKVTSEGVRYLEIIEELKSALPNNLEKAETFPSDLQYHQPQYEIIWEDCRERNI